MSSALYTRSSKAYRCGSMSLRSPSWETYVKRAVTLNLRSLLLLVAESQSIIHKRPPTHLHFLPYGPCSPHRRSSIAYPLPGRPVRLPRNTKDLRPVTRNPDDGTPLPRCLAIHYIGEQFSNFAKDNLSVFIKKVMPYSNHHTVE